jgi:hypothetical protein
MKETHSLLGLLWRGILAGIAYLVAYISVGMVTAALHIPLPNYLPPGVNPQMAGRLFLLWSPLLGLALVPLVRHTAGSRLVRGLAIFFFMFICLGVTSVMESKIFMTVFAHGGAVMSALITLPPTLVCGLVLSYLLAEEQPEVSAAQKVRSFFAAYSPISWAWRLLSAIVAFGVCYFLFGMMVAPFVVPFYKAGAMGLTLPPFSVIVPVLFIRSTLFLLASLPFLMLWTRSRMGLILSLGLAHWVLTGLYGMLMVFWWPTVMRVGHGLEIGADSFAYAAALVFLLVPRTASTTSAASLIGHAGHATS